MSYYRALGLVREPFSTSPDPELFYRSKTHLDCLQQMEIAIRLRRGLNVVLGDVGTGKSTLARALMGILSHDAGLEAYRLDDPYFPDAATFLVALSRLFGLETADMARDPGQLKDRIKAFLLAKGDDGANIVTLIVDEGQKMTGECLEMLRELLNFETNAHKLLQIVIFAQQEFDAVLRARPNLHDRVNVRAMLRPLDRRQTQRMIETRLALCSQEGRGSALFSQAAMRRVYRLTGGYPRKIVRLCNKALLVAVGRNRRRVTWGGIGLAFRELRGRASGKPWGRRLTVATAFAGMLASLGMSVFSMASMTQAPRYPTALSQPAQTAVLADNVADTTAWPSLARLAVKAVLPGASLPAAEVVTPRQDRGVMPKQETVAKTAGQPGTQPVASAPVASAPSVQLPARAEAPQLPAEIKVAKAAPTIDPQPLGAAPVVSEPDFTSDVSDIVVVVAPSKTTRPGISRTTTAVALADTPAPLATPAVAETPKPVVMAKAVSLADAPAPASLESLGKAVTRAGWIVTRQALWVYGNANRQTMRQLAKANPTVDFDRIRAGQSLAFPPIETAAPSADACLLAVGQVESLEQGMVLLSKISAHPVPLVLFVTSQPGKGLHFDVVVPRLYASPASARVAMATLPASLADKAHVVEGFPQGTQYFTDLSSFPGNRPTAEPMRSQIAETEIR